MTGACMDGVMLGEKINCNGAIIAFVTGLSLKNFTFLKEGGALGNVSKGLSERVIQARDELTSTEEFPPSFFCPNLGLSSNNGVLSVAGKKGISPFILLETLYKGRHVIYRIALLSDSKKEQKKFTIYFIPLTTKKGKELAKECLFVTELILNKKTEELLKLIEKNFNGQLLLNMKKNDYDNVLEVIEKWLNTCGVQFVKEKGWAKKLIKKE
jgi:hypothetical protein